MKTKESVKNLLLLSLVVLLGVMPLRAETIDSLYNATMQPRRIDYRTANTLLIALDAAECTDSLYTFTRTTSQDHMRMIIDLGMGAYNYANYHYMRAITHFMRSAEMARELGKMEVLGESLDYLVCAFENLGEHEKAIEYSHRTIEVDSILKDPGRMATSYNNLAAISLATDNTSQAITYIHKAITYELMRKNPTKLAIRYGIASEAYNKAGKPQEALHYAEMAYEIERKANNKVGVARRLSQMADVYVATEDYHNAAKLYLRSIEILEPLGEIHSLTINYNQLGKLYMKMGNNANAETWLLKAEITAASIGNKFLLSNVKEGLSRLYRDSNPAKAYDYLMQSMELQDSIQTERMMQMSAEYKAMFDSKEQANAISVVKSRLVAAYWALGAVVALLLICVVMMVLQRKRLRQFSLAAGAQPTNASETVADEAQPAEPQQKSVIKGGVICLDSCTPEERKFLLRIVDIVNANMLNGQLSVATIAQEMCMSRSQLTRRVNALNGGEGTNALITSIRIERAQRLLKSSNKPVSEVATECGFEDSSYFVRVFKNTLGMTPTQYRNMPVNNSR
ncbi:MAG: helix-turn-helix domain-containing protein [Muribaculaceae bacterium]